MFSIATIRLLPLLAMTLALVSCYMPEPVSHAVLDISPAGQFALDGQAISAQDLPSALLARHPGGARLIVDIRPSPAADITSINNAVNLVGQGRGAVAFAKADDAR